MNFLAHMFLSGTSDEVKLGNFMGDYVKGKDYLNYPQEIQKGILLHRLIDSFTDSHPVVKKDKALFAERYKKYAGVVTDIVYDHYLSTEWESFSKQNLGDYIEQIHALIHKNLKIFPEGLQRMVPYIIKNRWLRSYQSIDGLRSIFIGMAKGTSLPDESAYAIRVIEKNYNTLKKDFLTFFPEIIEAVKNKDIL